MIYNLLNIVGVFCAFLSAQLIMLFIILHSASEVLELMSSHLTLNAIWVCGGSMYLGHKVAHVLKNSILRGAWHIFS